MDILKKNLFLFLFFLFLINVRAQQFHLSANVTSCNDMIVTGGKDGGYFSTDKGKSWKKFKTLPEVKVVKIYTRGSEIFALSEKYGMYYSMDCGNTWESVVEIFEMTDELVFNINCTLNIL